jgi:hypothetical protein
VRASFRGTVPAIAFLIDVGVIGSVEARRRTLEMWRPGLDLRAVSSDRWLVILPEPVEVRSEYAIGLPLVASNSGLAQPGLPGDPGTLVWLDAGAVRRASIDALDPLPTEGWVDLAGHPLRRLTPLDRPEPTAVRPAEPEPPSEPDLRARVGIRTPRWRRRAAATGQPGAAAQRIRWGVVALIIVALLGIAGLIYALVGGSRHPHAAPTHSPTTQAATTGPPSSPGTVSPGQTVTIGPLSGLPNGTVVTVPSSPGSSPGSNVPWPLIIFLFLLGLGVGGRRRVRRVRVGAAPRARRRGWLARLVLHSPAQGVVRRRHERYLVSLTRKFERRDWDAALREAIALGGSGTGWLRLRLPRRRDSIGLRLRAGSGGSLYMGESAYAHLHAIYQRAAKQLDEAGQVDEAAFVYAELLHDAPAAVALLERNGRLRLAAELAEARRLATELVVRLWWRAGERQRAVAIARARGVFGPAVERLAAVDVAAALALREQWVRSCQAAGDHLAAVEAAWPVASLRRIVVPDIEAGIALGGPASGQLFAHLACEYPSEATAERAMALLEDRSRELRRPRERFIAALARLPGKDPAQDRRLCTAALRSSLELEPTRDARQQVNALTRRADPLVAADLPPLPSGTRRADDPIDLIAPADPGQLPVFDAVTLGGRALLVAHGEFGVRLLALDGRVRARWDIPAHQLVVADNGASALLVRQAGPIREIHRLDLSTRRVRPWTVLRLATLLRSYDGGIATVVDDGGVALLDTLSDQPRILWRELDREHRVLRINRTPTRLTALIDVPPPLPGRARSIQLWAWELPSMTLRLRRLVRVDASCRDGVVFGDTAVLLTADEEGADPKLVHWHEYRKPITTPAAPQTTIGASGAAFAVIRPTGDDTLMTVDVDGRQAAVYATFATSDAELALREHAGIITAWDRAGRIVAADPAGAGSLVSLRTMF